MENIVTAPKTDMFRFRINPEIRKQVEEVYAKNGLTFTEIKTNTLRASRWTLTPTSPPTRSSRQRKQWEISYPVRYRPFRYPLPLGSAFGSEKSNIQKWQLMKCKSPRNQTISRTFGTLRLPKIEPCRFFGGGVLFYPESLGFARG